ncbi:hypothetical protein ABEB36_001283 [Hypothenemus hampei]|uniref:Neuropeptide-like 4 n=1 Tax=Hypothenemus hampei TaxID=57062 RepID=A0ABD1FE18_HYPHA
MFKFIVLAFAALFSLGSAAPKPEPEPVVVASSYAAPFSFYGAPLAYAGPSVVSGYTAPLAYSAYAPAIVG